MALATTFLATIRCEMGNVRLVLLKETKSFFKDRC
jgi:hypothetical protein